MGSSFVELGSRGFWCNDRHAQLLFHLLADEIDRLDGPEPWLIEARRHWREQCEIDGVGCFSANLDQYAVTSERNAAVLALAERVLEATRQRVTSIAEVKGRTPRLGLSRSYVGDIPKEWFLQVAEAFLLLLRGELQTTASSGFVLPRIPQYQEFSAMGPEQAMIFQFWVRLEREQFKPEPGESVIDRLSMEPWESQDPRIKAAWEALTHPSHLSALEMWYQPKGMNPTARAYTEAALRDCRARQR